MVSIDLSAVTAGSMRPKKEEVVSPGGLRRGILRRKSEDLEMADDINVSDLDEGLPLESSVKLETPKATSVKSETALVSSIK